MFWGSIITVIINETPASSNLSKATETNQNLEY